jgi:hypothetical protein
MADIQISGAWSEIRAMAEEQPGLRSMAIAYVSLPSIPLRERDHLICNASRAALKSGATCARALTALHERKVVLYNLESLHAKIGVCGRMAFIGSANCSDNSERYLQEAVLVTKDGYLVDEISAAVADLQQKAKRITTQKLAELRTIKVDKRVARMLRGNPKTFRRPRQAKVTAWIFHARYIQHEERLASSTRKALEKGREHWRETYGETDDEPQWFTVPRSSRLAQVAKPGMAIASVGISGSRRTLDGIFHVFSIAKTRRRTVITCRECQEGRSIPWGQFLTWATENGLDLPRRHGRQLAAEELEVMRRHRTLKA